VHDPHVFPLHVPLQFKVPPDRQPPAASHNDGSVATPQVHVPGTQIVSGPGYWQSAWRPSHFPAHTPEPAHATRFVGAVRG